MRASGARAPRSRSRRTPPTTGQSPGFISRLLVPAASTPEMSRPRLLTALFAALLLAPAAPAHGATVAALGGGLEVRGAPGEVNTIRVTHASGRFVVTETSPFTTV